eukprot:TRINITY_DN94083_c0_g1_i1.p1 TRINITY_DN94083_c0_g1~~TRINITY_DN94083_c0_g1_i1.p1  ORF type:complete len:505 (-),score=110.45 TRINITY_DN94083_c0_g1_i1:102-1616(-)
MAPIVEDLDETEQDTEGVELEKQPDVLGGGVGVKAARPFKAGEVVFSERALVVASSATNLARVRSYCLLPESDKLALRDEYWCEDPGVRCAATAACRADSAGTGDSASDVLAILHSEGFGELTLSEVETVIRVWNLNAYDNVLGHFLCKVNHSCAPNVTVHVDPSKRSIQVTACRALVKGEVLGTWYCQDTGLWWMGTDLRRAMFEQDRGFRCSCVRCRDKDRCRALPCDACNKGFTMPEGAGSSNWQCESCGRTAAGDTMRLAAEGEIAPRVLVELKPPKNHKRAEKEELEALALESRGRLGRRHWLSAATAMIMHFRGRPAGGALDATAVAYGCRFLGWLIDAQLPLPPASIVRTPVAVSMECAAWLGPGAIAAKDDRRCIAARLLNQYLLPLFDASGGTIAHVANTGMRVEALRKWLETMQGTCGREGCGRALASGAGYKSEGDDAKGAAVALACSRCRQVRYCCQECQKADWKERHKNGCLPATESLAGDAAWRLLTAGA